MFISLEANCVIVPEAVKGILDLRNVDFNGQQTCTLNGEWEFVFGHFLDDHDFDTINNPEYCNVPGVWNGLPWERNTKPIDGFATYHLTVLLARNHPQMALNIADQSTAYQLIVNGRKLASCGRISKNKELAVPEFKINVVPLGNIQDTLQIIFQISNYHYRKSGLWQQITIGNKTQIIRKEERTYTVTVFITGGLFLISFILIWFFIYRPQEKASLWSSLIALGCVVRVFSTDDRIASRIFPEIPFELMVRMELISLYVLILFISKGLFYLFPNEFSKKTDRFITFFYGISVLIVLIFNARISSFSVPPVEILTAFLTGVFIWQMIKAVRNRREGALIVLISYIIIAGTFIFNTLITSNMIVANIEFPGMYSVLLSIVQVIFLSRKFSRSLTRVENFAGELEITVEERTRDLRYEKEKSDKLLLNVLPVSIAHRIKEGERTIADHFDEASVIFIDIVDFTKISEKTQPKELVLMLNDIFSKFDQIAAKYGLEKIKTIGDCYMAASGIPETRADHAFAAAQMALEIKQTMQNPGYLMKTNEDNQEPVRINFRMGLDCGPTVAGVIGEQKFIYDLWGDMVNTASRMESHGEPGKIQCSDRFARKLIPYQKEHNFNLSPRGEIMVKGKGIMKTWFLE